jgi:hypothetical protein
MNYPAFDLADLDAELQEDEVRQAILDMTKENAPRPDGFIGAFYIKCWEIVKNKVVQSVRQLSQLRGNTFNLLNTTNIVLLLKKEQALSVGDYRSISLVHSVANIFSKTLANRLAPHLANMVSLNQSAFVKKDVFTVILSW